MTHTINPFQKLIKGAALASVSSFLFISTALAGPNGGQIESGAGSITGQGTNDVIINQSSGRIVINWADFNSGINDRVEFKQPNANALAVNRINNGTPTEILGSLRANGQIIVINPNGVILGNQARVDVNKLVLSTADIATDKAMNDDKLVFDIPGHKDAKIINRGAITAGQAGLVGFIAPHVENNGTIDVKLGKAHLASGSTFTLDLAGDELVNIAVSDDVVKQLALNSGHIKGNQINITATQARNAVDKLIVNTGVIEATSVSQKGGRIILGGDDAHVVHAGLINVSGKSGGEVKIKGKHVLMDGVIAANGIDGNGGTVEVTATETLAVSGRSIVDVFGAKAGHILMQSSWLYSAGTYLAESAADTGGTIQLLGDNLYLAANTFMNASGLYGGGNIYIGGDFQGKGDMHTATNTAVELGALIVNDAVKEGDGGQTIIWSDNTTEFFGTIFARGKGEGKGGFTEVSGKEHLNFQGDVDLTSESGIKGTLLLDPNTITVYGNVDPLFVSTDSTINLATNLQLWLDASDATKITLSYSTSGVGTTASGVIGSNTITTAANVSANLAVGARIRLNTAGGVTTATTMGADTYTIAAISGTTITTVETLSQNYVGSTFYRGLVSQWTDKSGANINATQGTASRQPLWISSNADLNGTGAIRFFNNAQSYLDLVVNSNNAAGGYNSAFFSMNWTGTASQMPFGFTGYDLWFGSSAGFGFNTGGGNVYGVNPAFLANSWHNVQANFYNGSNTNNSLYIDRVNQTLTNQQGSVGTATVSDNMRISGWRNDTNYSLNGRLGEIIMYSTLVSGARSDLLTQYQTAKTGIGLSAPGTGATEAQRAMSATGFDVFTTDYLQYLSQTADVNLLATNTITLDLQGDNLSLANDRNITFTTTSGNINSLSSGTITTNRTGTGGNITFNAGGTGNVDIGNITLDAQNGGTVNVTAGGNIFLGGITSSGVTAQTTGAGSRISTNAIAVGNGNISLTADDVTINGNLSGTGTLTLQPNAVNRIVNLNNGADNGSTFHISTPEIGRLSEGWSTINIGRTNGANDLFIGASTWTDPVRFRNAIRITVQNALAGTDDASFTFGSAGAWTDLYSSVTTDNQNIDFSPSSYVWVGSMAGGTVNSNGGDISFNRIYSQNNGNMSVNSAGGTISIADTIYGGSGAGRTYSFNAGGGNIAFGNTVNAAAYITASAANITLGNAWGGTTALGNVSLTAANALSLPSIRAQTLFAQSGVGSNITLTGTLTALAGGNSVILNSGQHFINSGNINPGAGRYLVYSTNPGNNTLGVLSGFTKRYNRTYGGYAPGSVTETGNVMLYSAAPVITVTGDNATRIYGDVDPAFTANYSGFIDGDNALTALSGTADITTDALITSDVGAYAITPSVGTLMSALGYGFTFADGTLSVTPAALTATADNKTKVSGTANPVFTVSITGLRNGDLDTLFNGYTLSTPADNSSPAGLYLISLAGGNAGSNYTVTNVDGQLTVDPAPDLQPELPYKQLFNPEGATDTTVSEETAVATVGSNCLYKIINFDGSVSVGNCGSGGR